MRQETMTDQPSHTWRYFRATNIALRTAHICTAGIVAGGHIFDIGPERILLWTWTAILTGAALMILEAFPSWGYICEGRGAMVIGKLLLLCLIPWLWHARVPILIAVIVIGSVGSHMPRKYRHFSLLPRPRIR
jgi:hypothetical protein